MNIFQSKPFKLNPIQTDVVVEVFRTNVENRHSAQMIMDNLFQVFPFAKINFDLDDCERILRIEGDDIHPKTVVEMVCCLGFQCAPLE